MEEKRKPDYPSGRTYLVDGHTHTFACGHAYSTLMENVACAKKAGIELFCWTEHSPAMPGSATEMFFSNMKAVPPVIDGVRVLKGMEADILNEDGEIACSEALKKNLEILSASFHTVAYLPHDEKTNTRTLLNVLECNPEVDFLCHLGNPQYPIDFEEVVRAAKKHGTMIEINNGSFMIRKGSKENCIEIARLCKKHEVPVILGTDTHFCTDIGQFQLADRALVVADFPDELIVNLDPKRLTDYLEAKGKPLGRYTRANQEEIFDF